MFLSMHHPYRFHVCFDRSSRRGDRRRRPLAVAVLSAMAMMGSMTMSAVAGGDHAGDIIVGRSGDGQLKIEGPDLSAPFLLNPVNGPPLFGWTGDEPGFDALAEDEPDEDFFTLEAGVQVRLEVVAISPAVQAWAPAFSSVLDEVGDNLLLGGNDLHDHLTWHIDSQNVAFDPDQIVWSITFKLIDVGSTSYAESEPFTLLVTNIDTQVVPAVSTWGVIVLTLLLLAAGTVAFRLRPTVL